MRLRGFLILTFACCCHAAGGVVSEDNWSQIMDQAANFERTGATAAAQGLYSGLLEETETHDGAFSETLIEPLLGLARCNYDLGDFEVAEQYLRRAQHIVHRNRGVHSLAQLEMIDLITEIDLKRDEPFDADREQQMALYLNEREYGKDSLEMLPALSKLAEWYTETGQYFRARRIHERSIELIETQAGPHDPRLIRPMIQSAELRRLQRMCCTWRQLENAEKILDANPDLPSDARAEVYEALADAYVASGKDEEAKRFYALAWAQLGDEIASEKYAEPTRIVMAKELERAERANARVYVVNRDTLGAPYPLSFEERFQQLSLDERLLLESQPPQQFLVPPAESTRNFHIVDSLPHDSVIDPAQRVVGKPFQFIQKQLQQILPLSIQSDEELALLRIEIDCTVDADGRPSNVEINQDGLPNKLVRLLKDVVFKTKFRPRLVNGEPAKTDHFTLVQTFDK